MALQLLVSEKTFNFVIAIQGVAYILVDESVIAFCPCVEIWKISLDQGEQSHSSLCIGVDHGGILALCSNTSVGYCLFDPRYSRTSTQINDSAPHFLFALTRRMGAATAK